MVSYAIQHPGLGPNSLRLGEAIYGVLPPAGFRAGTSPQTSDEFVRRLRGFFAALPPGEFPHTVQLAPLLARISTDDQFQTGIQIFIAGLQRSRAER